MNENVNVCITPKGDKPILHFSQFDNERVFTVTVLADDGESAAVLTGLDIEFRIRKTDSHVVTIAPESVADNVITFKTTEQMCACCGQNIASVVLMKDDMVVSTLDILVDIQRDILSGGLTSESDIRNLTKQIEQIVPEVVGDDYYTKTEVDELIDDIPTFDPSNYYNKIETDNLLSAKMDNIGYHGFVDDAAVISFTTDCNAPLDIIKGKITPVQSGSGTPSPQNVRPISGFSALNVTRTGKNLFSGKLEDYQASTRTYGLSTFIAYKLPNGTYTISTNAPTGYIWAGKSLDNGALDTSTYLRVYDNNPLRITLSGTQDLIVGVLTTDMETALSYNTQLELGNQASEYHAYNGQTATVNFGQTVYGGVADVTNGKVNVTHGIVDLGSLSWTKDTTTLSVTVFRASIGDRKGGSTDFICTNYEALSGDRGLLVNNNNAIATWNMQSSQNVAIRDDNLSSGDATAFKTAMSGVMLVYKLATPIEITTTPVTVSSISGDNNIFIDTGNMTEIAYFENAEGNLIKLIKACQI